jgi:nucleoside-diphosphate-sugar epimerase
VQEANSKSLSTCVLRPSVLFGKGDTQLLPPIHACLAKQETPWIVGDGTNLWDVTYVDNVADAHVLAAQNLASSKTAAGEVFFIQNNEPIAFRDFCLEIWKNFGHVRYGFSRSPEPCFWPLQHQPYSLGVATPGDVLFGKWEQNHRIRQALTYTPHRHHHLSFTFPRPLPGSWAYWLNGRLPSWARLPPSAEAV